MSKDHRDIMLFAFRYALGRKTFAPIIVQEYIKKHSKEFTAKDYEQIAKEIEQAERDNCLGDPEIDAPQWINFKAWCLLTGNNRQNVLSSTVRVK